MLYISSTKEQTRAAIELDDGSLEEARVAIDWRQWNKMKKLRPMTTKWTQIAGAIMPITSEQ